MVCREEGCKLVCKLEKSRGGCRHEVHYEVKVSRFTSAQESVSFELNGSNAGYDRRIVWSAQSLSIATICSGYVV